MSGRIHTRFRLWLIEHLKPGEMQKTLLSAAAIGFGGALATIAFKMAVARVELLLFGQDQSLVKAAEGLLWWQRLLVPSAGGLLAGYVLLWAARYKKDTASDYMEAVSLKDGALGARFSLIRATSSLLSIATGSSIGREGSMVQLSALVGAWFGRWRSMSVPQKRLLVACGGAAGITAAYNAPIGGALFIAEIVLRSIAIESLGPLIVASVVANMTIHALRGSNSVYQIPAFHVTNNAEIVLHGLLGVIAGLCAPWFLRLLDFSRAGFQKLPWPLPLRLALGGAIVGLLSVLRPEVWGNGYSVVNGILAGQWLWQGLLVVLICKILATAATAGSGAVGGIFTPTLFVGAAIGQLWASAMHAVWPSLSSTSVFAATGMAAFLAATTYAPLTASLMLFEMTGNYQLMPPLLLASVLAYFVARLQREKSIYAESLKLRFEDRAKLAGVADMLRASPPTVGRDISLLDLERTIIASRWQHVYVVDANHCFLGAVSLYDVAHLLQSGANESENWPEQLLKTNYPRISIDATLGQALDVFAGHAGERVPVLGDAGHLQGYISKTDVMLLLQQEVGAAESARR